MRYTDQINKYQLGWIIAAHCMSVLLLLFTLHWWLPLYWSGIAFLRVYQERAILSTLQHVRFMKGVKLFFALLGLVAILVSAKRLISVETFVSFFVVSFSLKLLELHTRRAAKLVLNVCFMGLAASFLFSQSALGAIYVLCACVLICLAWRVLTQSRKIPFQTLLTQSSLLLFQAIPIMLLLFVVLPRMGQLWHMPSPTKSGVTGFSDTLSAGEFSSLAKSGAPAFRVTFDEQILPLAKDLYWRGLVLDHFDGKTWSQANKSAIHTYSPHENWRLEFEQSAQSRFRYTVLQEPHQHRALFTLMAPVSVRAKQLSIRYSANATLLNRHPINSRTQYRVISDLNYRYAHDALRPEELSQNLRLPDNGNSRAREYALTLSRRFSGGPRAHEKIVANLLSYYNERFTYTLQPPALDDPVIDAFLFESRRGFCEHFASSFAFLARAAGIPARLVVGYQGGEYNPYEHYLIVRQSDAHAWTEVWQEGRGWYRVDPTAAVAPERIENGLREALGEQDMALVGGTSSLAVLAWMQMRMDALSYNWHRFVLGYGGDLQSGFLTRLFGGTQAWRIALGLFLGVGGLWMLYFLVANLPQRKQYHHAESRTYARHLKRLEKHGFHKEAGESPLTFAERVSVTRPEWKVELLLIAKAYSDLAYAGAKGDAITRFEQMCRSWYPR